MDKLQFNFTDISFTTQLVKVQEELGELIKAVDGKDGDIQDEMGDVIISVYGLCQILKLDYIQTIHNGIEKINNRLTK